MTLPTFQATKCGNWEVLLHETCRNQCECWNIINVGGSLFSPEDKTSIKVCNTTNSMDLPLRKLRSQNAFLFERPTCSSERELSSIIPPLSGSMNKPSQELLDHKGGGHTFLWISSKYAPIHPRRRNSLAPLWEPQIQPLFTQWHIQYLSCNIPCRLERASDCTTVWCRPWPISEQGPAFITCPAPRRGTRWVHFSLLLSICSTRGTSKTRGLHFE
jgi:hypothetical protein